MSFDEFRFLSLVTLSWVRLSRTGLQICDKVDCEPEHMFESIGILPGSANFELEVSRSLTHSQDKKAMQKLQEQGISSNFSRLSLVSPISPRNH